MVLICFQEKIIHSCRFVTVLISYCTSKYNIQKDEKIQNIISSSSSSNFQLLSCVRLCAAPWTADTRLLCPPGDSLDFAQIHMNHWVGDAIQLSPALLSPLILPSIFPRIRVFFNESALHIRSPKYSGVKKEARLNRREERRRKGHK